MARRTHAAPGREGFIRLSPLLESPAWEGKLGFRNARAEESGRLRELYEASWGLGISREQIEAKIANFPQGQIVGFEKGTDEPVSMINIMLGTFSPGTGFPAGYAKLTGGRTFSTHSRPEELMATMEREEDALAVAYCVSIAVHPAFMRNGFAYETLNYAIEFAELNGYAAAPYSAPRGFGKAREAFPSLKIGDYLRMTVPSSRPFETHASRVADMGRAWQAFRRERSERGTIPLASEERYTHYNSMPPDRLDAPAEDTAFGRFLRTDGPALKRAFGRTMTIEDFCIISGRRHIDPTMRMHIENGARFIRKDGRITAVFEGSRPEDAAAAGYNVVLSYSYRKEFGHPFAV